MLLEPDCSKRKCRHFEGVRWMGDEESTERNVCKAFPKGIPAAIAYDGNPHTEPYPGDHGVQFEPERS